MVTSFIALLFRMKHINRWSLMRSVYNENLAEHTLECALLTHFLATIGNTYFDKQYAADKLAAYALYHDTPEILTGDLPTPVKYFNEDMRQAYGEIEKAAADRLLSLLPSELADVYRNYIGNDELPTEEKQLLKIADKLCAYIKCVIEIDSGNSEFSKAYASLQKELNTYNCAELDYFLSNCLKAFSLSLDDLNVML